MQDESTIDLLHQNEIIEVKANPAPPGPPPARTTASSRPSKAAMTPALMEATFERCAPIDNLERSENVFISVVRRLVAIFARDASSMTT